MNKKVDLIDLIWFDSAQLAVMTGWVFPGKLSGSSFPWWVPTPPMPAPQALRKAMTRSLPQINSHGRYMPSCDYQTTLSHVLPKFSSGMLQQVSVHPLFVCRWKEKCCFFFQGWDIISYGRNKRTLMPGVVVMGSRQSHCGHFWRAAAPTVHGYHVTFHSNNNMHLSVPFLLWSTRPIARNKISERKKKLSHFATDH